MTCNLVAAGVDVAFINIFLNRLLTIDGVSITQFNGWFNKMQKEFQIMLTNIVCNNVFLLLKLA